MRPSFATSLSRLFRLAPLPTVVGLFVARSRPWKDKGEGA